VFIQNAKKERTLASYRFPGVKIEQYQAIGVYLSQRSFSSFPVLCILPAGVVIIIHKSLYITKVVTAFDTGHYIRFMRFSLKSRNYFQIKLLVVAAVMKF
jgi:hypothetical protein